MIEEIFLTILCVFFLSISNLIYGLIKHNNHTDLFSFNEIETWLFLIINANPNAEIKFSKYGERKSIIIRKKINNEFWWLEILTTNNELAELYKQAINKAVIYNNIYLLDKIYFNETVEKEITKLKSILKLILKVEELDKIYLRAKYLKEKQL